MTTLDAVSLRRSEGILHVVIERPEKRNALSRPVLAALAEAFAASRDVSDLRAVVLRGRGDRSFAAGGDLRELETLRSHDDAEALSTLGLSALAAIRRFPVPVIAALNGDALGGGAELAMACDVRVAAPWARFGFVQASLNLAPAWGGGRDLMQGMGAAAAMHLLVEGRSLTASEAHRLGLVQAILPSAAKGDYGADFDAALDAWLAPYRQRTVDVMRAIKAAAIAWRELSTREFADRQEREYFIPTWIDPAHWKAADRIIRQWSS